MGLLDIFRISRIKNENARLQQSVSDLQSKLDSLKFTEYTDAQKELDRLNLEISMSNSIVAQREERIIALDAEVEKKEKQLCKAQKILT